MSTLLESVQESLKRATRYNPDDAVRPAAVLWPDPEEQWQPVVERLRPMMPELLTLGNYQPERRTGPVIWLRCAIEGVFPEQVALDEETVPVIYLPGVGRQDLRASQECRDDLKPLIELLYRGVCWTQRNGRDWTVEAFLVSKEGGLGLDMARDAATRRAMHASLSELVDTPLSKLDKHLEAEDFNRLLSEDPIKDILQWLNDPEVTRKSWSDNSSKWEVFRSICQSRYSLDPESDGELVGAELLAKCEGEWKAIWQRFAESPGLYPGIPELLRRITPDELIFDESPWPQKNEAMEKELRTELLKLDGQGHKKARDRIRELEVTHGKRREWVWTQLGWSPLAEALRYLHVLAERTESKLSGASLEDFARKYAQHTHLTDLAAIDALATVKSTADIEAVTAAVRSVYLPWLQESAEAFQEVLKQQGLAEPEETITVGDGNIIMFVDGLRFDVACRLTERMREYGWNPTLGRRWSGIPTVTATGKYLVAPIAPELRGGESSDEFLPTTSDSNEKLTADRFRKLLAGSGYEYISQGDSGDPSGRGWTEYGNLDELGHSLEHKLAAEIDDQIDLIAERIQSLFDAGWKGVRLVTDHGWLLMPGGLPKADLPRYLTESRWSRCAAVKGASKPEIPVFPWTWNGNERIAMAPGICCFTRGHDYAHGGISVQECLVPDIWVYPPRVEEKTGVSIEEIKWLGLRCHVKVVSVQPVHRVDLRTRVNDESTSQVDAKQPSEDGIAKLLVADEELEGSSAVIVVLDSSGHVLCKKPTVIGGES